MHDGNDGISSSVLKSKKYLILAGTGIVWACLYILFKLKNYEFEFIPLLGWRWLWVVPAILAFSFAMQMIGLVRLRSVVPGAVSETLVAAIAETLNVIFFNIPVGKVVEWASDYWSRYRKKRDEPGQFFQDPPAGWAGLYHQDRRSFYAFTFSEREELIPHCVVFDNTRIRLPLEDVAIRWDSDISWITPAKVRSQTSVAGEAFDKWARRHDRNLFNGSHLRLNGIALQGSKLALSVQPVKYFESFLTNNVQDVPLGRSQKTLREAQIVDGRFEAMEKSEMANLFGVNHLITTCEGDLVVAERSRGVAIRPGYFTPSAAGDFDGDDFGEPKAGQSVPFSKHSVTREVAAELGQAVAESLSELVLLGIAREVARGGKPDSFFAARSSMTFAEIEKSWKNVRDRWEGKRLRAIPLGGTACRALSTYLEAYALMRRVEDFATKYGSRMSVTLRINLEFWIRYELACLQQKGTV
jgi:hypothetical protein